MQIEFESHQDYERHICTGTQDGEWVIFTCEKCTYEQHINIRTKERILMRGSDNPFVLHTGAFLPSELQGFVSSN